MNVVVLTGTVNVWRSVSRAQRECSCATGAVNVVVHKGL